MSQSMEKKLEILFSKLKTFNEFTSVTEEVILNHI